MSREHFKELKQIYKTESLWQAAKYDFDKSAFRLLVPYAIELIPIMLGKRNYQTLIKLSPSQKESKLDNKIVKSITCIIGIGSETARYIATAVTYNETKSLESAISVYILTSGFFSMRNQFKVDRFYKPNNKDISYHFEHQTQDI